MIFVLFLLLLLLFLFSCKNEPAKSPNQTEKETLNEKVDETNDISKNEKDGPIRLSKEEKSKFFKLVEFDLPENFRDALVDYMFKCSEIKWTAKEDFSMIQDNVTWTVGISYKKGTVYHGVP